MTLRRKVTVLTKAEIARVAHEVNRAYCQSIGDHSQLPWECAPQWQKDSAVNGVEFHQKNPHVPASASHENWLRVKVADGWKYGPVKDPAKKEHPCMVSFADLPQEQKVKDHLFQAVVHALSSYSPDPLTPKVP